MKVSLKKKLKIILPIVLVVVVALGGVVAYAAWKNSAKPTPAQTTGIKTEDIPQYGACEIVTSNTIKETFGGDKITQIVEGVRIGEKAPNGTIAESCKFAFSTEHSNSNSFTVSVYDYTPSEDGTNSEAVGEGWSEVGGSTPIAYFGQSTEDDGKTTVYMYRILPGSKNVLLSLRQPTNAQTYNRDAAFDFIGGIASKANLTVVETKTTPENSDATPGAVTDNP